MKPSQLQAAKSLLREQLRRSLKSIPVSERRKRSRKVIQRLLALPWFQHSSCVLTYVALPEEVATEELILKALAMRKQVYVPFVDHRHGKIGACAISHFPRDLREGDYGILEPKPSLRGGKTMTSFDLIVVPGLGFDRSGGRLGRGAGYFDRFLRRQKRAKKVGIAFREQIVRKIPQSPKDIKMDRVICG